MLPKGLIITSSHYFFHKFKILTSLVREKKTSSTNYLRNILISINNRKKEDKHQAPIFHRRRYWVFLLPGGYCPSSPFLRYLQSYSLICWPENQTAA